MSQTQPAAETLALPSRSVNVYLFEPPAIQFLGDQHVESMIITKFKSPEGKRKRRPYRRQERTTQDEKIEWVKKGPKLIETSGFRRRRSRTHADEGMITEGSAIYAVQRRRSRRRVVAHERALQDEDDESQEAIGSDMSDEQESEIPETLDEDRHRRGSPRHGANADSEVNQDGARSPGPSVKLPRFLQESDDSDEERLRQPPDFIVKKSQDYFLLSASANKASQRTLEDLPLIDREAAKKAGEANAVKHALEKQLLKEFHESNMPAWYLELRAGFNILFYGFGSKKQLIQDLARKYLVDAPVMVVNGYFPLLNIKQVLVTISEEVLGRRTTHRNPLDHLEAIRSTLLEKAGTDGRAVIDRADDEKRAAIRTQLYILIHNIDGLCLRSEKAQMILSQLASMPGIRILASIDHINAPILWNGSKNGLFNWVWHDLTTYDSYVLETAHEPALGEEMEADDNSKIQGTCHVLRSLTVKARNAFKLLADFILANDASIGGMSYSQYLNECRQEFLVSNDQDFRSLMVEFKDHQIITAQKTLEGSESYIIPISEKALRAVLKDVFPDE